MYTYFFIPLPPGNRSRQRLLRDGGSRRRRRLDVEVLEDRVQLGVRVLGLRLEDLDLAQ